MNDFLQRYVKLALGKPFSPGVLSILVTSVCDMRCAHCFFTAELDDLARKRLQMTTAEIEKISETLGGNLGVLILAGGEPFIRKDLPEIARAFHRNNNLKSLYITTNGQIQQRIFRDLARILDECPALRITIALGIDGLRREHDKIRRQPGSWDIAMDTARRLLALKQNDPHLGARVDVQTCTCVMRSNQDAIFAWYDFLKHDVQPDKINFNYIRPPAADPLELDIDSHRYACLARQLEADSRNGAIKNHYGGENGWFKAALDVHMHGVIARTVETQRAQLTCYAGTAGGVIYDNGAVSSCENLPPIGNLRDYGWNFRELWLSAAMRQRRRVAADGCFCTHEPNCYYPSLPFNPRHLVQIKLLERQMKKGHAKKQQQGRGRPSTGEQLATL